MRHFHHALTALVIGSCAPIAVTAPTFAQTCACAPEGGASQGYFIQADEPPPPLPEYDQPPIPAPGYYWTPGYWAWNNYDYYWVPGAWVEPPWAASMLFDPATGASASDSTAESITDSVTPAPAIKAAAGTMGASSTIQR
jgi:hypothetical protein